MTLAASLRAIRAVRAIGDRVRKRPVRALLSGVVALVVGPAFILVVAALFTPLPPDLAARRSPVSVVVADRNGRVLREVRTVDGVLETRANLGELSAHVVPALIAAEDVRFYTHPGVDPIAIARAVVLRLREGHVVSGASTITQQLARTTFVRPRTFAGKFREMALALRIEASLGKAQILEEYLSRVEFAPNVRGIEAASRFYLDKPAKDLDLAEAAELVALVRGPSLYDPRRRVSIVKARRDRVLERMRRHGLADPSAVDRALEEPLRVQRRSAEDGAPHLALELARGALPSGLERTAFARIDTTLDADLEREVETLARRAQTDVERRHVTALAAVVVDNASGDVLAYVGSPNYFAANTGGANDGVHALRQPGSTLKPFVYAAAMERLGATAATLLPDIDLTLDTGQGGYTPKNYDGRTHGPVRLREALADSLNIPAVVTASQVGPAGVLDVLHRVGFASLKASAADYGAAIALGDGEVRLSELAEAYSSLARGGIRVPLAFVRRATTADGRHVTPARAPAVRVLEARTVAVLSDVLADDAARASAFGRESALFLPFPVAAKTGTSKGYRDNWAVGFTHEVTVAVWAGNFDGEPMIGSSGITGAAPLFHDVMVAAMRGRTAAELVDRTGLVDVEVCALSGERPSASCPHRVHELFRADRAPRTECSMHVHAKVVPADGLLAGGSCASAVDHVFEAYPPRYLAWANAARRPTAPERFSPLCPGAKDSSPGRTNKDLDPKSTIAGVRFPRDGARFVVDPGGPARQEIVLSARPGSDGRFLRFVLDGRTLGAVTAPFELPWALAPGTHRLEVETPVGERSTPVTFEVDARCRNAGSQSADGQCRSGAYALLP